MSITVTLNFSTVAEAAAFLSGQTGNSTKMPQTVSIDKKPKETPPEKHAQEAPAKAEPVGKSQSAPPAVEPSPAKPQADAVPYEDVKKHVLALAKIAPAKAAEALKAFDVDHGTKLKPEQYADFIAKAMEMGAVV